MPTSQGVTLRIILGEEGVVVGVLTSTAGEGVSRRPPKPERGSVTAVEAMRRQAGAAA